MSCKELLDLDPKDQARLAQALLEALGPPDPYAEEELLEELERRSDAIDAGLVEWIPAQVVIASIRKELECEG